MSLSPSRRWSGRRGESGRFAPSSLLIAQILSKFGSLRGADLGGAALGQSPFTGTTSMMVGIVLVSSPRCPMVMLRPISLPPDGERSRLRVHGESWRVRAGWLVG